MEETVCKKTIYMFAGDQHVVCVRREPASVQRVKGERCLGDSLSETLQEGGPMPLTCKPNSLSFQAFLGFQRRA